MTQKPRRPTNFAVNQRLRNRTGTKPPTIAEQQRLQKAAEDARKKPAPTSRTKPSPTAAGRGRPTVAPGRTVVKPPPVVRRPSVPPATTPTVPSRSPLATPRLPDLRSAPDQLPPGGPPPPPRPGQQTGGPPQPPLQPGQQTGGPSAPVAPPPGVVVVRTKRTPALEASTKRSRLRRLMEDELEHKEGSRLTDAELAEVRAVLVASGLRHERGDFSPDPEIDRLTTLLETGLTGRARATAAPVLDESTVDEKYVAAVQTNLTTMQAKNRLTPVPGVADLLDEAERLLAGKRPVSADRELVKAGALVTLKERSDKGLGLTDREDDHARVTRPGFLQECLDAAAKGVFDQSRLALSVLSLSSDLEDKRRLVELIDGLFAGDVAVQATQDPKLYVDLLVTAALLWHKQEDAELERDPSLQLPNTFVTAKLDKLGPAAPDIAARMLPRQWNRPAPEIRDQMFRWVLANITDKDWNDRSKGLAAKAYNALWNAGMYDEICDLIDRGVDAMQPANLMVNNGRPRDGIWSGFVQPLEHLLGNYVKLVHEGGGADEPTRRKVAGAEQILARLQKSGNAKTLTTYADVVSSEMIRGFADAPGTVWGFEDVRLPYVQAARDTKKEDKKVGQRPLRMIDLWKTVELVLSKEGYTGLLEEPDRKIPEYVKLGVQKIDDAIADRSREVAGIDRDLFVKAFEEQATAYLTFLASQTPSARFATTALSRRDIGKHMGALACKAGLWWAKEMKEPIYYVLDGIKMEQATDYKSYKSAQINQIMDSKTAKDYLEVITFAELREILKNWDELEAWVKFVERGSIVKGDDLKVKVKKWRDDMAASDLAAPARTLPDKARYADAIAKLDPTPSDGGLMALDGKQIQKIVSRADMLKMAARAQHDLLGDFLAPETGEAPAQPLYEAGVLPERLGELYVAARDAPPAERADRLVELRDALVDICVELRVPLQASVARHFGY